MRKVPLLGTQLGIVLADQIATNRNAYVIAHAVELHGEVDLDVLAASIRAGLAEADTVTARYVEDADGLWQLLRPLREGDIPDPEILDLRVVPDPEAAAWAIMAQDVAADLPVDGERPLTRELLIHLEDREGTPSVIWYQRHHHLMLDGFSFTALTRRIAEIYSARRSGRAEGPSPFESVAAVVEEYRAYDTSPTRERDAAFWRDHCRDLPAPTTLAPGRTPQADGDASRPAAIGHLHPLAPDHSAALAATAEAAGHSLLDFLVAAICAYVHRLTEAEDLVVGMPLMRRMGSVAAASTAPVVNVLPLRLAVEPGATIHDLAHATRAAMRQMRRHQRYDAEAIQRDLGRVGRSGLYGPVINYRMFDEALDFAGVRGRTHHLATGPIDDIEFGLTIEGTRITLELRANSALYDEATLGRHAERLERLLLAIAADPALAVAALPVMTEAEERALTTASSTPPVAAPLCAARSLVDLFRAAAARDPAATALVHGDRTLDFAAVSAALNRLARHLLAEGVREGDVVAVAVPRSEQSVIAMLAVLASGATYLPLDLDHPPARLADMCADASPAAILTTLDAASRLPAGISLLALDAPETAAAVAAHLPTPAAIGGPAPDGTAYIIFTSGSTGRPKGVMVPHRALLNLYAAHWPTIYGPAIANRSEAGRPLRAAHTHSFAFDSSWLQIFWMLAGQELHIVDETLRRDALALVEWIRAEGIDTLDLAPSICAEMIACGLLEGPHRPGVVLIGGEAAPPALWTALARHAEVASHNLYGPTEYTVDALRAPIAASDRPVIGRPIGGTTARVLDRTLNEVPPGAVGELYLAGAGLADGYLGRPGLTAERFVADPFGSGGRIYRTGDLVRREADGTVAFVGRRDGQVKVRGYRIEVAEVEAALQRLDRVEIARVVAEPVEGSHRLLAYVTLAGGSADPRGAAREVRAAVKDALPDHMVPAIVTVLDHFPLTINGKIDTRRLPRPSAELDGAPGTPEEARLVHHMAAVLKLPAVGTRDDFFELGGDSISAIVLCGRLRGDGFHLRPGEVFAGRDARGIAARLRPLPPATRDGVEAAAAPRVVRDGISAEALPLLPTQKGMLYHALLGDSGSAYNAFTRLELDGPLDAERLARALDHVVRRHPQLHGLFDARETDEPRFLVPPLPPEARDLWSLETRDLTGRPAGEAVLALARIEATAVNRNLLGNAFGHLIGATLVRLAPERHALILVVHHLVIDGWSTPLLLRDLFEAYASDAPLPALPHAYGEVVRSLAARDPAPARIAWAQALREATPTRLFEGSASAAMEEAEHRLSRETTRDLLAMARRRGVTLNILMQGVFALVLGSLAGRNEVVFGTPVAGRGAAVQGLEEQIGLFLSTIPVRVRLDPDTSLWDQLAGLQEEHAHLMEHDTLGLGDIQSLAGGKALFDTLLVVENYPDNAYLDRDIAGLRVRDIHNRGHSHYPLALLVLPGERLTLLVENRGALADAQAFADRIAALLETLVHAPAETLATLPVATRSELALADRINATEQPVPPLTLRNLLHAGAGRDPEAPALTDGDTTLSFGEVRRQALHLARRLADVGVTTGDVVAVALPRSARLSLALYGVIEAGASYLPLDLSYPSDRLAFMLADARPRALIADGMAGVALPADLPVVTFDALAGAGAELPLPTPDPALHPSDPAYLIYTSGTTGRPKGVVVPHGAIVNRLLWMQAAYDLRPGDRVLQKTPCGFDVSVWEFFWPAVTGAELVMAPPEAHRDPALLIDLIEEHRITLLHFVPSMLAVFLATVRELGAARRCASLRKVFCSGEALPKSLARDFHALLSAELHNLYGPTEAAIDVTYAPATAEPIEAPGGGVPIGWPVWNTKVRVLDHLMRPVPPGAPGELYLCGHQLAAGYLGRPGLTASRFVADPFAPGERMYRTGDVVRRLPDGALDYLGRSDHQIKIRGQRVELGEIEAQLERLEGVRQAVADALVLGATSTDPGADERQLVAWVVPDDPAAPPEPAAVIALLKAVLPAHMVPAHIVGIAALPVSVNGKLDRKALPRPERASGTGREPAEGLETRLAAVFAELVGRDRVGAEEDFFAIGGHSLLAMRLAARIRRDLGRHVSVGDIILMPTVERLAEHLEAGELVGALARDGFDLVVPLRPGARGPLVCIYPASGVSWQYSVLSRYLAKDMAILGLQSPRPHGPIATSPDMDALVAHQLDILRRAQPRGPYYLLGYSLGGTIAYGLAVRLRALGEEVRFLGLLDTYPAEAHDWSDPSGAQANRGAEREQEQFINAAMADVADDAFRHEKEEMFGHIFENYNDSVRLLSAATTPPYEGRVTLFVAGRSVPPGIDPDTAWEGLARNVAIHRLAHASHDDIISPASLEILGPLIDRLLAEADPPPAARVPALAAGHG
ncbi:non-ribosomal peptide synthetase [Acuticoccus mangrovi]|uniref:Amino acid adenylation domain-containing protein n=1 Tax=Acuticoccus mangrovi TaxID=2796142 RepID=A0A934IU25_9HYPH|nr:non-ribosomal peptide synthetase [Acuticoccus mangrovi]MBJ3778760.1 amino acid adenylation domain-containing protein [Acuticoccus mangrovi]